jgi:hypothetical protein
MKRALPVLCGIAGAIVGFIVTLASAELFLDFGTRNDPIMAGLIGLLTAGAGGVAGSFAGAAVGRHFAGKDLAPGTGSGWKVFLLVAALTVTGVAGYSVYAISTATPWLKPGGIVLVYEIRLPSGTSAEAAKKAEVDLQTAVNSMPYELHRNKRLVDGDPLVLAGLVDLAFRTAYRQLELKIPGQSVRSFDLKIAAEPKHSPQLGPWQKHPDGGEIRYRVVWPGQN